jgi:hypothetical protein
MLLGVRCLGGLGSCVGEGVASSVRRAVGVMLPPLPSQCAPCAPCFFVWSGTPFPVPSAAWKRCLCNFEESGWWLVCGGRGQGQGQGQVWEHFSFGVSLAPPLTALPCPPPSKPAAPFFLFSKEGRLGSVDGLGRVEGVAMACCGAGRWRQAGRLGKE